MGNSRLRNAVEGPSDGGCPGSDVTDCPVPHCSLLTSVPVQRILPNLHPVLPSLDRKHKKTSLLLPTLRSHISGIFGLALS